MSRTLSKATVGTAAWAEFNDARKIKLECQLFCIWKIWKIRNTVFQKGCHLTHVGSFVKPLQIFETFFTTGERKKFPIKFVYYFQPHLNNVAACTTFGKLKFQICRKSGRKCKHKMSHEPVKFPQLSEDKAACKLWIYHLYSFVD